MEEDSSFHGNTTGGSKMPPAGALTLIVRVPMPET
jgi:hypothetical protein